MKSPKESWFAISRQLSPGRAAVLTAWSFLLPLSIWSVVSYVPFIWHPDVKLEVGSTGATIYTAGDHVGKDYFPTLLAGVRDENAGIAKATAAGEPIKGSSRDNVKLLRMILPIAISNGVLTPADVTNDAAIYGVWHRLATGDLVLKGPPLSEENLAVIRDNWAILATTSETYEKAALEKQKLLSLIPQGKPANPVYLPAPHEVLIQGYKSWTEEPAEGRSSMGERLRGSIIVVFGGFLLAALVALPLGIVAGSYDFFSKLTEPFLDFFRYMPAPSFATLLVAIFGAHQSPKLALVFIGTLPHLCLMITKTTRILDSSLLEAAQTLGSKRFHLLRKVVVPGIVPEVYNDLRIALGWAWTWLVIAELIGVKSGLTEVIDTQGTRRNFDQVFPVILLIGIIGFVTDQFLAWLRPKLFRWTEPKAPGLIGRWFRGVQNWFEPVLVAYRKG